MRIVIPNEIYQKVMYWVHKADFEVSGFGKVTFDPETQAFTVVDAILLKQEGGATHTDIDPASLGKAMYELRDAPGDLNWWWHSHVKMATFWSSTDTDTIKSIGRNGYCVATVFNQKNESKSAFCSLLKGPLGFEKLELMDNIPLEVRTPPIAAELITQWDGEFDTHVAKKIWSTPQGRYGNGKSTGSVDAELQKRVDAYNKRTWDREDDYEYWNQRYHHEVSRSNYSSSDSLPDSGYVTMVQEEARLTGKTTTEVMAIYTRNNDEEINAFENAVARARVEEEYARENQRNKIGIVDMTDTHERLLK